nr:GNAT family protein [Brooklawnia cerclae]
MWSVPETNRSAATCEDLSTWTPRPGPERRVFDGRYVRLEPLEVGKHADDLYEASSVPDAPQRFRYLFEEPAQDRSEFQDWVRRAEAGSDPLFYAVVDKATGRVAGRQALMRIDNANGVIEIGNVYWGPAIARTTAATEALFLLADHVFGLGYRRFEWKCNNDNEPSKRAAERFGFTFEGIFRQHMIQKGRNRDTAWFAIIDEQWPSLRTAFEAWLDPENFDHTGRQKHRLEELRTSTADLGHEQG